jgi:hypothetical protein
MPNETTITDLTAAIERMTLAVESASATTNKRLADIEARLAQLEVKGPLTQAIERVGGVEGSDAVRARIDEALTHLVDAETLESLARVAVLAPKLEYALQAVAAGPELLEEGLDEVRKRTADGRLRAALDAANIVTDPSTLPALARVAARAGHLETSVGAAAQAARALEGVYGTDAMHDRIAELVTTLGDPETLESLTRMAALAPKLEYALQAVAAGPELLEEGLDVVRNRTANGASIDARLAHGIEAATKVTEPRTMAALGRVASKVSSLEAPITAAADAVSSLSNVHGAGVMNERLGELLLTLGDPETLESLARIVTLVPKIEYAVQALAAGPELLEEGLDVVRARTRGGPGVDARLNATIEAASKLTEPATIAKLASIASSAARLEPIVKASVDAVDRVVAANGREGLELRVSEAVVALADHETLDALTRVVTLLPKIEYAVQALAAGPELLEEALESVRKWSKDELGGEAAADQRLRAGIEAAVALTQPTVLRALSRTLPELLTAPGVTDAIGLLVKHAPRIGPSLDRAIGALDKAMSREGLNDAALEERLDETLSLLLHLSDPKKLEMLRRASRLAEIVDEALHDLPEEETTEELGELIAACARPETLSSLRTLVDTLPGLAQSLAALPVQPHTLQLLRTLNEAVESASMASEPLTKWGLWRALGDPSVQATLGLGVDVVRRLGGQLGQKSTKLLKE